MTPIAEPRSPNGFTLIEMLVALAVFSLAALALLRLDGFAIATAVDLDGRMAAQIVLQNEAALITSDPGPIVRGSTSANVTNAGRRFAIRRVITPTADARLVRIDLTAVESGGAGRAALTLVKRVQ